MVGSRSCFVHLIPLSVNSNVRAGLFIWDFLNVDSSLMDLQVSFGDAHGALVRKRQDSSDRMAVHVRKGQPFHGSGQLLILMTFKFSVSQWLNFLLNCKQDKCMWQLKIVVVCGLLDSSLTSHPRARTQTCKPKLRPSSCQSWRGPMAATKAHLPSHLAWKKSPGLSCCGM